MTAFYGVSIGLAFGLVMSGYVAEGALLGALGFYGLSVRAGQ